MTRARTLILAAALGALAMPAAASDQLARSMGLEPGLFSTAELAIMREAAERNDDLTYRTTLERGLARQGGEILSTQSPLRDFNPGAERAAIGSEGVGGSGKERLAAAMGVDPDDHTLAELAAMFIDAHD